MAKFGGIALKTLAFIIRVIEFASAAIVLGIFCWFLAILVDRGFSVPTYVRAVTGISGAAVIYTAIGALLVYCLAGRKLTSPLAILFDIAFTGAFIYVAWALRGGASSCRGDVATPFGNGNTEMGNDISSMEDGITHLPRYSTACRTQKAAFAVSIIACILFFISALLELALMKHHRKEKAFGPSPSNGYTSGSPKRKFWQRKPKHDATGAYATKTHPDALPAHTTPHDVRDSYATETTAVGDQPQVYNKYAPNNGAPVQNDGYTATGARNNNGTF